MYRVFATIFFGLALWMMYQQDMDRAFFAISLAILNLLAAIDAQLRNT